MAASEALRAITYLSPGIPLGFFEHVVEHLARELGRPVTLTSDDRVSGPMHADHDPFASGVADIGFLCSPSYLYLRSLPEPSVELVPVGFVFRDPRNGGKPLYYSDVIVRADRTTRRLDDLRDGVFGYNDSCSLSGFYALRQELARRGWGDDFFRTEVCTGSHRESIKSVLAGSIDVAAIDSNILTLAKRRLPELSERLRVIESWGPYPIQPVVAGTSLPVDLRARIASALLGLAKDAEAGGPLAWIGLERCVPTDESLYDEERRALEDLGQLARADC